MTHSRSKTSSIRKRRTTRERQDEFSWSFFDDDVFHKDDTPRSESIVKLDTHSIRQQALKSHNKAETTLAKLKSQLKRYHEEDIPGFRTWLHQTFGQCLTRQRELQHELQDKYSLVLEIRDIGARYRLSELDAFRKVLWRREHPDEARAEDELWAESQAKRKKKHKSPSDEDDFLEDDATQSPDPDYDLFDDDRFEADHDPNFDAFKQFFESFFQPENSSRKNSDKHPDHQTVKELYRAIVRRLHPDHHGHMPESRKNLWHEAQDAYRRNDANALYIILARCDKDESGIGSHTPVSWILRIILQLKQAATAARGELRQARRDPAWDYQKRIRNPHFVAALRYDLENAIQSIQSQLAEISEQLDELSQLVNRPAKAKRRRKSPRSVDYFDW